MGGLGLFRQWGSGHGPWWRELGLSPREPDDIFVKISYFITVLTMTQRYLHSLPTSVQYEMEEKSISRQKSGRDCPPCPIGPAANSHFACIYYRQH